MRTADVEQIRLLPLFRDMEDHHFDKLATGAMLQRLPQQIEMIREGERPDFLHVIVEGLVELYSERGSDELGFSLLRPASTFILAAVVRDAPYLNSARTLEASRILMIPAAAVRKAIDTDIGFSRAMAQELATGYRRVLKELKNRKFRPTLERLANWLLREIKQDAKDPLSGRLRLPFDKRKLAAHIGTSPENLSRTFAMLGSHGVLVHGRDIIVSDIVALTELAKPDPLIDDPLS